jgi:hypothetical protein
MSKLSRRSLVTSAAALPALAVPALAEGAGDDAELLRLAAAVETAYDALGNAIDVQGAAESKFFQWKETNPEPSDEDSADWFKWRQRQEVLRCASGYYEADAAAGVASGTLEAAVDQLCETRAHTICGLIEKARLGEIDDVVLGNRINRSILDDLLALNAVGVTRAG